MKLHQRRSACKARIEHGFTVALLQCNMFFEKKYGSYYTYYIRMVYGKTFNILHTNALEWFKQLKVN